MAWGGVGRRRASPVLGRRMRVAGALAVAAALTVAVPLSASASARAGIVISTKPVKLSVKGFHSKLAIASQLASNWDATKSGTLAVGTFYGSCGGVVAVGTVTVKPQVISDFDHDGLIDCYPQTQVQFLNVSTDGRGKNVAFQAAQSFGPGITNPDLLDEVYLSTAKGVVQITGSWSANGWSAWGPAVSGDGKLVAFVGNGDPKGSNGDGSDELFLYNVSSHAITQLTNVGNSCTISDRLAPATNSNGNRIAFVSTCNLTGENPGRDARPFVLDRHASKIVQLASCTGFQLCDVAGPIAISSDGSTLANVDVDVSNSLFNLVLHRLDAQANETSTRDIPIATNSSAAFLILESQGAAPSLSAKGDRIAFTGAADLDLGMNPAHEFNVFVVDQPFGTPKFSQITKSGPNVSYGSALDDAGRTLYDFDAVTGVVERNTLSTR
jgi:hypothetical protein